jgi:hypothetical protein
MKTIKFYDTSSLLLKVDSLFEEKERFAISSITLEELEHIKTAANKDADIKYAARKLTHILDNHMGDYNISTPALQRIVFPNFHFLSRLLLCLFNIDICFSPAVSVFLHTKII